MPLIPWLVTALAGVLVEIAGYLAGRVLIALAFGFVTYTGVSVTLDWLKSQMLASFSGLSVTILGLMAVMKIGEAVSILFSALLVRLTLNGLSAGGSISKMIKK